MLFTCWKNIKRKSIGYVFLSHPRILDYDYEKMKSHFLSTFGNELIQWQFHPNNQEKWKDGEIYNYFFIFIVFFLR